MTQVRDAPGEGGWRSFAGIAGEGGIDSIKPRRSPYKFFTFPPGYRFLHPAHPDAPFLS